MSGVRVRVASACVLIDKEGQMCFSVFRCDECMCARARVYVFINTPSYRNAVVLICVAQRVLVCAFQIGN
jgi:hypothetical protein